MKPFPTRLLLIFSLLLSTLFWAGCGTPLGVEAATTPAQKTQQAHKFAAIMQTATSGASYLILSNNPEYRESVITAAAAIRSITGTGIPDRQIIIDAITQSSEHGAAIAVGLESALALYGAFLADNASLPADSLLPYASIVLNGIAQGAETGARLTTPPPTATPAIPPGFFKL